jgi:hypothetical protein
MSLDDTLADVIASSQQATDRQDTPAGWTPGIQWDEGAGYGEIVSPATQGQPDWSALIGDYLPPGWDAAEFDIDPSSVRFTSWDGWTRDPGEKVARPARQHAFRARIIRRRPEQRLDPALLSSILKRKAVQSGSVERSKWSFVFAASDWQVGKAREGGWEATAERWQVAVERMTDRVKLLSKTMGKPERIVLLGLGDLGEGCKGHYPMQAFSVVLNQQEQNHAVMLMLDHAIEAARKLAPVDVLPVGGNHGEERNDGGKAYTDFSDNRDVAVFKTLAFAYGKAGVNDVRFALPTNSLTQTVDLHGVHVGIAHGHQFARGANAVAAAESWWKGQMAGKAPIGHADILVAGHRHHLIVSEALGARTFMQAPAIDGGSEWFQNLTGASSRDGVLSFVVDQTGWSGLAVL